LGGKAIREGAMAFSLIPKEEKFFELFELQAEHAVDAAKAFKDLAGNFAPDSDIFARLEDIEHEADITTHEVHDRLNRTFVTPFDREDIHALAGELDDIVDLVESISTRMRLYRVDRSTDDLRELADILWRAALDVRKAISELKNPDKKRRVLDHCIEINRLENAGDRALDAAIGRLFQGAPDPLEVIKWKEIYEGAEAAIDKCEDVANIIESILVKQA
jgi:predicted phosphate transport protein (TIGR00153 family)